MKYAIIMMNYPFVYLTTIMLASLPVITLNAIAEETTLLLPLLLPLRQQAIPLMLVISPPILLLH